MEPLIFVILCDSLARNTKLKVIYVRIPLHKEKY